MKTNPNDAASARPYSEDKYHGCEFMAQDGLTKLEYFSALAMQGFTASTEGTYSSKNLAEASVRMAKALIDELNKKDGEIENETY